MSESINLGQVNISTDKTINGSDNNIKILLTFKSKRLLTKIIKEKNTNKRFNIKNANFHSLTKTILQNAINITGTEKKIEVVYVDLLLENKIHIN